MSIRAALNCTGYLGASEHRLLIILKNIVKMKIKMTINNGIIRIQIHKKEEYSEH